MSVEPTITDLITLKQEIQGLTYWLTEDFFPYNQDLEVSLGETTFILNYVDYKNKFEIAKIIIKAAKKVEITPQEYLQQLNNYGNILSKPFCLWKQDKSGKWQYKLTNTLTEFETFIPFSLAYR
ncbi:hypothetical protein H6G54_06060 [Anabaena cylindrica FACHB-243]|uniref:Uncharacterized protein n=1 Tax=Anabaena cylindrica (strain ATCC 27899 / PCC 7122) TaxID=272123 RepID=K9ZIW1_ANACC|nr:MULTISPECIES: hypothetical protein [Anabaena]AFZ58502.1 hypothetical protein Anacy_3086 [Anabaena cylindrica PCC 7122]MBD2417277.1 hypothetical protein [Anabaena cylindrica FACHB-243]MBY5281398.1 hypothetical protein [Anabaena sp. CCAP 1446/1C]MBY5310211.1 hypothetical protein [Anabaena sp. CCAP 1446/1C]MCM2410032.1 hypothetical protein [Anabaena sp. CCAP 1446/1C]